MKNTLLLVGRGYIGEAFIEEMERRKIKWLHLSHRPFGDLRKWLSCHPEIELIINCAAFITKPSVDLCEDHKRETLLGNLVFPTALVNACELTGTPLLHVSTGCLYNGNKGGKGYSETDPPQLTFDQDAGFYVGSKQLAEEVIRQYDKAYLCRIRIPFDQFDNERNYLSKIQRYPRVYNDRNSLSHRGDFVKACLDLWQRRAPYGIYNVTNPGAITTEFICAYINTILDRKKKFQFWDHDEFHQKIARTTKSNCVLDASKLLSTGVRMRPVQDALEDSLRNWVPDGIAVG